MLIPTPTLVCVLIVVLLPDWLSSAELRPPPANQIDADYFDSEYPDEENPAERPLWDSDRTGGGSWRQKRLMGIFRCNGWGPGCTQLEGASEGGDGGGGRGRGGDGRQYRGGEAGSLRSPIEKFQPFFTLTSGGSWGPTGKRSSPRLHVSRTTGRKRGRPANHADYMTSVNKRLSKETPISRETLLLNILSKLLIDNNQHSR